MDIMNELSQMIKEADAALPFKPNSVRKDLDFQIVPGIVFSDAAAFIRNCMNDRKAFICSLFNHYYEVQNPLYYPEDPKKFRENDFAVLVAEPSPGKCLLQIALPEEFAGSLAFCSAYVLTYEMNEGAISNVKFFTIEDSMYGWQRLGCISPSGEHTQFGYPTGHREEDLKTIFQFAFQAS